MSFQIQPFEVRNFNLGIVEDFQNFDRRANVILENLVHTDDDKVESRFGSELFTSPNQRIPSQTRVTSLVPELDTSSNFFVLTDRRFFHLNPNWTELKGPTGNFALPNMESDGEVSTSAWRGHLFLVDDRQSKTVKIFRNSTGTLELVEAGLPALDNTQDDFDTGVQTGLIVGRINGLKAALNTHYTTTPGTTHKINDPTSIVTVDAVDLATAQALLAEMRTNYITHKSDMDKGSFLFHTRGSIPWTDLITVPAAILEQDAPTTVPNTIDQINDLTLAMDAHFINQHAHNANNTGWDQPAAMPIAGGAIEILAFDDPLVPVKTGIHPVLDETAFNDFLFNCQNTYLDHLANGASPTKAHDIIDVRNDLGPDITLADAPTIPAVDWNDRRIRIRDLFVVLTQGGTSPPTSNGHMDNATAWHGGTQTVTRAEAEPDVAQFTFFFSRSS